MRYLGNFLIEQDQIFSIKVQPKETNDKLLDRPIKVSAMLCLKGRRCLQQAQQTDIVHVRNLIRTCCMSPSNSGYFTVIYLCLLSGERTDGMVS